MIKILFPDIATIVGFKTLMAQLTRNTEHGIECAHDLSEKNDQPCVKDMADKTGKSLTRFKELLERLNTNTNANSINTPVIVPVYDEFDIVMLYEEVKEASELNNCLAQILEQIFEGSVDNA